MDIKKKSDFLSALGGIRYMENQLLSELTTFCIGGPCAIVLYPETEEELIRCLSLSKESGLAWKLIGKGSNILAPDNGFDGILICFIQPMHAPVLSGNTVCYSAGESMRSAAEFAADHNLSGLEGLEGIPGTIGGACAMNAGAYEMEIKQVLRKIRIYKDGEILEVDVQDADLGKRRSEFTFPKCITLDAYFELTPDSSDIRSRMEDYHTRRVEKQPLDFPSAGSVFKRPEGHFAGGLIESSGMKGSSVGDAMVSEKHAGFIINNGHATSENVQNLISTIQEIVYDKTGIRLERELKFLEEV